MAGSLMAAATPVIPPAAAHGPVAAPAVVPDPTTAVMGSQQALSGTVPDPTPGAAGPDVAKPDAVKPTAAQPAAVRSASPEDTRPRSANHDVATAQESFAAAKDVANRQIANDVTATPQVPDHHGAARRAGVLRRGDTSAPAPSVAAGADAAVTSASVPAATVHAGLVAPTTGVPALSGPPASAPAASAPSALPVPVQHQVFAAVGPLLRGDDGSYAVQLQLHPHDLGAVQVTVDVRHGEISVQLHSPDPAAQDALRDGLADLRRQLEDQGLRTGSMEVGSGGADPRQRDGTRRSRSSIRVGGTAALPPGTGPLVSTAAGTNRARPENVRSRR